MIEIEPISNIAFTGSTKSGKTYLAKKILRETVLSHIHYLVIIGPTVKISGDYDEFKETPNPRAGELSVSKFDDPSEARGIIEEIVQSQDRILRTKGRALLPKILVIIDDMVGHPLLRFGGYLDSLSTKSRHYQIGLWVLAQRLTAISRTFRLNARYLIAFSATEFSELERFLQECVPRRLRRAFEGMVEQIYDVPHAFVLVHNFATRQSDKLWKNAHEKLHELLNEEAVRLKALRGRRRKGCPPKLDEIAIE